MDLTVKTATHFMSTVTNACKLFYTGTRQMHNITAFLKNYSRRHFCLQARIKQKYHEVNISYKHIKECFL